MAGQIGNGRANHAKTDSLNKHLPEHPDGLEWERGPPPKRRRTREPSDQGLIDDHAFVGRPPVRLAITQPHVAIQKTTNGIRTDLVLNEGLTVGGELEGLTHEEVDAHSPSIGAGQEIEDKRVLRSRDVAARGNSELANFIDGFYDIVHGHDEPRQ